MLNTATTIGNPTIFQRLESIEATLRSTVEILSVTQCRIYPLPPTGEGAPDEGGLMGLLTRVEMLANNASNRASEVQLAVGYATDNVEVVASVTGYVTARGGSVPGIVGFQPR